MFQETVWDMLKTRCVIISANDETGPFTSRLYVNRGETATSTIKKAKTLKGALHQADDMLSYKNRTHNDDLREQRRTETVKDIQETMSRISRWVNAESQLQKFNWADVGSLCHVLDELQQIASFIYNEED